MHMLDLFLLIYFQLIFFSALDKFRDEANSMSNDFETYLSNPLSSFALIRHQQQDWHKWALFMKQSIGEGNTRTTIYITNALLPTSFCLQNTLPLRTRCAPDYPQLWI